MTILSACWWTVRLKSNVMSRRCQKTKCFWLFGIKATCPFSGKIRPYFRCFVVFIGFGGDHSINIFLTFVRVLLCRGDINIVRRRRRWRNNNDTEYSLSYPQLAAYPSLEGVHRTLDNYSREKPMSTEPSNIHRLSCRRIKTTYQTLISFNLPLLLSSCNTSLFVL